MINRTLSRLLAMACLLPATLPTQAHHSQAAFDTSREITFEATVHRLDWKNPHIYLIVEITEPDGSTRLQQIEGLAITQALVDGLDREALSPGTRVLVRANPNHQGGGKTIRGLDVVTVADGKVHPFYQRRGPARDLVAADSLNGKWAPSLAETGKAFGASVSWPYTALGRGGRLVGACDIEPIPFLAVINEMREIVINEDSVVFNFDNSGDKARRVVYLNQDFPETVVASLLGHSIGHWDQDTLVIETTGYIPHVSGLFSGYPAGAGKRTTERLSLSEDRTQLRYEITVEDPDYLQAPGSLSMLWDHRPDLDFTNEPCDEAVSDRYLDDY